ncbi:hypothetical protein [Patulibacter minatonensis]|uniref:hypothetical protein n=1 Tax=Patulibacter minatonensis TaxID=298163 RepID=UPI0004795982|nr:hypothetical protein [Patulibacter minatonensis]
MLARVLDLTVRIEADPRIDASVELDALGLHLVVLRHRIERAAAGAPLGPSGDADLFAARRALAEALVVVGDVIGRLDAG